MAALIPNVDVLEKGLQLSCRVEFVSLKFLIVCVNYQDKNYRGFLLNCESENSPNGLPIKQLLETNKNIVKRKNNELLENGQAEVSALSLRHTYNNGELKTDSTLIENTKAPVAAFGRNCVRKIKLRPRTIVCSKCKENTNTRSFTPMSIQSQESILSIRSGDQSVSENSESGSLNSSTSKKGKNIKSAKLRVSIERIKINNRKRPRICCSSPDGKNNDLESDHYHVDMPIRKKKKMVEFSRNDVIWAKLHGYPWWPGRILDCDGVTKYNVAWFASNKVSTSIKKQNVRCFRKNFQSLFNKKRLGNYRQAVEDALFFISPTLTIDNLLTYI